MYTPMSKTLKKIFTILKKLLLITLLIFFVLAVVSLVLYESFLRPKVEAFLRAQIQHTLETQLKREVSLGAVQLNFPNPQVIVSEIAIAREQTLADGTLLTVKALRAKLLLRSLLFHHIILDDIVLDTPTVWIEFDAQGRSNLPTFAASSDTPQEPSRFDVNQLVQRLYFPHIQLINGAVHFAQRQQGVTVDVASINTTVALRLEDLTATGTLRLEGGRVQLRDRLDLPVTLSTQAAFKDRALRLTPFQLTTGQTTITADGVVNFAAAPELNLAVTAQVALDELDRILQLKQNLTGLVALDGTVTGRMPDVAANVHLTCEAGTAWKLAFARLAADVQYQALRLGIRNLTANMFDGALAVSEGEMNFAGPPAYKARATLEQINLEYADIFAGIDLDVVGTLNGALNVEAATFDFNDLILQSDLTLRDVNAYRVAADTLTTKLAIQQKTLTLQALKAEMFQGRVTDGAATILLDQNIPCQAQLTLENIALTPLLAFAPTPPDVTGTVSGQAVFHAPLAPFDMQRMSLQTTLALREVAAYGVNVPNLATEASIQDNTLALRNLEADLFQGKIKGDATLGLDANFPYQGKLSLERIALTPIMALIPTPPDVAGLVSGRVSVQGTDFDLPHLALDAALTLQDVTAFMVTLPEVTTTLAIQDQALQIKSLAARLFEGTLEGAGKLVLAGTQTPLFETTLAVNKLALAALIQQLAGSQMPAGVTATGLISGRVTAAGNSFALKDIQGEVALTSAGEVRVDTSRSTSKKSSPISLPLDLKLAAALQDQRVTIAEMALNAQALQLNATGTFELATLVCDLNYAIAANDLQALLRQVWSVVPGIPADSPLRQFSAKLEELQGTLRGSLHAPEARVKLHLKDVDVVWGQADEMRADLALQNQIVTLHQLSATYRSASVAVAGTIDLTTPANPQFHLPITLTAGKISDYLALAKQTLPIEGKLRTLETTVEGTLADLRATAKLQIADGAAYGQTFDLLAGQAVFENNRVSVPSLVLKKNGGQIALQGAFGLDQTFDVAVTARDFNLHNINALADVAVQYQARVDLTLQATGTLAKPQGQGEIRFKQLNYNGTEIEDVTSSIVLANQTVAVTLKTFRQKLIASGSLGLNAALPYHVELVMQRAAVEQILALATEIHDITGVISGKITSDGSLNDLRHISAIVKLSELELDIFGQQLKNQRAIDLEITPQKLTVNALEMNGPELGLFVQGILDFQGNFDLDVDGILDLRAVMAFLPKNLGIAALTGRMQMFCSVRGNFQQPEVEGIIELNRGNVKLDAYPDPISELAGKIALTKGKVQIVEMQGKIQKGTFAVTGEMAYHGLTPGEMAIDLTGQNIFVHDVIPALEMTVSPTIRLSGNLAQQKLSGQIEVQHASYTQEIDFLAMASSKNRSIALVSLDAGPTQQPLLLDLHIRTLENARFQNKLADIALKGSMRLQGSTAKPQIAGRVEVLRGRIMFGDNEYELLSGAFDFLDPLRMNPEMNIQVETIIQQYKIRLSIDGNLDQFNLNMSSVPALTDAEITRLLAMGSKDKGAGYNLVTKPLQTLVEGQIEKAIKLDRFSVDVDPISTADGGTSTSPKVTLAKRLFNDLLLTFTTTVGGAQKEQTIEVEYEISHNISLTAKRNERGVVDTGFTFKIYMK